jgi:AraC family transcriptional regulator
MKPETRSFYELAVQRAVERVVTALDGALDLQALARTAALSPFHFHRIFRGMVGETPLELHRRLRLERAAWQLLHDDLPVTTVAFAAGYETHESFTRAFRLHYDCSPSEFRQSRDLGAPTCASPFRTGLAARSGLHFEPERPVPITLQLTRGESVMNVEIKDMNEMRVAAVEHVGPYNRISEAFARLGQLAGPAGLFRPDAKMLAIYRDDPETTPASELHSEAGITVPNDAKLLPGLREERIPAGRYACTIHKGPYEGLGDTWARFMGEWLPKSGHRMKDTASFEIYRNTPENTPKDKLETELCIPLE